MWNPWTRCLFLASIFGCLALQPRRCAAQCHKICGNDGIRGGCLCVAQDGSVVFGSEDVGTSYWGLSEKTGGGTIFHSFHGKRKYLTIDEEGKQLYFTEEMETGSMWEYTAIGHIKGGMSHAKQSTIRTAKALKGGPFYLAIDFDNAREVKSPYAGNAGKLYLVYPVKITADKNSASTQLRTRWYAP